MCFTGIVSPGGVLSSGIRPQFQCPPGPFIPGAARTITEAPPTSRIPPFNAPVLQPPPVPPDIISTEQDRQTAIEYETWLNNQNVILQKQLKYYETEVQKLRKVRKVSIKFFQGTFYSITNYALYSQKN